MGKSIVILNGSPRKNGNTAGLIEAFTQGAEAAGNTVTHFFLDGMNIHGCKGCYGGGKNPDSPCVQKDDMDAIYPAYKTADVVVLASPLYFWQITGQLKTAIDRLFAMFEGTGLTPQPKDCALLMAAEGSGYEETNFYYDNLMKHLKWNPIGKVLATGVNHVGDIKGKPELEQARALGASIG